MSSFCYTLVVFSHFRLGGCVARSFVTSPRNCTYTMWHKSATIRLMPRLSRLLILFNNSQSGSNLTKIILKSILILSWTNKDNEIGSTFISFYQCTEMRNCEAIFDRPQMQTWNHSLQYKLLFLEKFYLLLEDKLIVL